jgi:hypothetical protein
MSDKKDTNASAEPQADALKAKKIRACMDWLEKGFAHFNTLLVGNKTIFAGTEEADTEIHLFAMTENELCRWYDRACQYVGEKMRESTAAVTLDEALQATREKS